MRTRQTRPQSFPRARLETLFDGIVAVAMTLLVLDIHLPEDFHPTTAGQLVTGILALWPKILPYLISFYVLGNRWLDSIQIHSSAERLGGRYISWWLFYLLQITMVPFTTIVLGRYAFLAPAVWLYLLNTAAISIASWRMLNLTPELENQAYRDERAASLIMLLCSLGLCFAWSFINPTQSLWFFLLNLFTPMVQRLWQRGRNSAAS